MSGSDPSVSISRRGGTGAGGVGANDGAEYRCPGAPFQTVLASPDPEHVASLSEGELLNIEKIDAPVRGVVATLLTGEQVGAISRDIVRLRECIDAGPDYEAEVLRVSGGSVTVSVRPR